MRNKKDLQDAVAAYEECRKYKTVKEIAAYFLISETAVRKWAKTGVPKDKAHDMERLVEGKVSKFKIYPELKRYLK